MKKLINILVIFSLMLPYFMPIMNIKASTNEYIVVSIKNDGTTTEIGKYDNYTSAKEAMNKYNSNINDVAAIKRNGVIVNVKYGIFRPSTSNVTVNIYSDYSTGYISPGYNTDNLFLDYDPDTNKVQVMVSGLKGWLILDKGTIYPISYITDGDDSSYDASKKYVKILYANGIRLREGPGTEYKQIGCNGATTCSSSQGGIWASQGSIYEWLNYGNVTNDGTNDWYQVNINGNIGYIANEVATKDLEEYIPNVGNKQNFETYYYVNNNGELYHQYYAQSASSKIWKTRLGKAPLYLKQNVNYYSFDGNYFYDDFTKMVNDLRNGNFENAVNKMPYYNYYQYLPTRTQTNYNAENLNSYIGYDSKINRSDYYQLVWDEAKQKYKWTSYGSWSSFPSNQSMLYGEGESFIESQTTYGVNAAQTLSVAITESGWGRSYMSVREYNLFGHGAFDTAPDEYASSYESIKAGIMAHAFKYIVKDYSNPISGSHYYGSHYGNKLSGNNVSYASDAYWGEKMAGNYYSLDKYFEFQDFSQRLTLGIKQISDAAPVYSKPTTESTKYYNLKNIPNIPVTILEEVEGQEINGNKIWYKIQSDVPIDEARNVVDVTLGTYNFETSYAYVHSSYIYKESQEPIITANDITLKHDSTFKPLDGVSAYDAWDGDVTSKIVITNNKVDTKKAGIYEVVYSVTDSEENVATKTIKVTVLPTKPTITANDKTVNIGSNLNLLEGVSASDAEDGDLTDKIQVSENIDINNAGTYDVTYSVTDKDNNTVTKTIKLTVISNKPTIEANNITILMGDEFNPLNGVKATDIEDGDITKKVTVTNNTVDINTAGIYSITYSVTDSHNNTVNKTVNVEVLEKELELKESIFYLDYIKEIDGDLVLKGYSTINGINNTLENKISYKILFENVDTGKTLSFDANRITDRNLITRVPFNDEGFDYTYSWFEYKFDLDKLPQANYKLYVVAQSDEYYSISVVSNKLYKQQDTSFIGAKSVLIYRNFNDKTGAIEFNIRNKTLANKNSSSVYNQYDTYRVFEFVDNKLYLKGLSYSYGMDLSKEINVTRKIIFENKKTYETYYYDLGSVTEGLYNAVLPVDDNLDKTRAWYDNSFDITNIPKGEYIIYITTTSNITDIAELTEKLGRNLDSIKLDANDKKYSFIINKTKGNRIELKVE